MDLALGRIVSLVLPYVVFSGMGFGFRCVAVMLCCWCGGYKEETAIWSTASGHGNRRSHCKYLCLFFEIITTDSHPVTSPLLSLFHVRLSFTLPTPRGGGELIYHSHDNHGHLSSYG